MADERARAEIESHREQARSSPGEKQGRRLPRDLAWPELPYAPWKDTRDTLHRFVQVVGKLKLAQSPFEAGWQNVPLFLTARGLTTGPVPHGDVAFEAAFDFFDHELLMTATTGEVRRIPLGSRSVADFYDQVLDTLHQMGLALQISDEEVEIPDRKPFSQDTEHASYAADPVHRFFRILSRIGLVLSRWRARFRGKVSPVEFWWGTFDLSLIRFSGRPADPPPRSDRILRYAMDAEEIAAGFWPGDERYPRPAFYAYAYPKPDGIDAAQVRPAGAGWSRDLDEFLLPYDDVRAAPDPEAALIEFLDSAYEASASLAGWDREGLEVRDTPPPARQSPRHTPS